MKNKTYTIRSRYIKKDGLKYTLFAIEDQELSYPYYETIDRDFLKEEIQDTLTDFQANRLCLKDFVIDFFNDK